MWTLRHIQFCELILFFSVFLVSNLYLAWFLEDLGRNSIISWLVLSLNFYLFWSKNYIIVIGNFCYFLFIFGTLPMSTTPNTFSRASSLRPGQMCKWRHHGIWQSHFLPSHRSAPRGWEPQPGHTFNYDRNWLQSYYMLLCVIILRFTPCFITSLFALRSDCVLSVTCARLTGWMSWFFQHFPFPWTSKSDLHNSETKVTLFWNCYYAHSTD